MAELQIWTTRQTIKVAAPPKRVYELIADIEGWPAVFDTIAAVERLGNDRDCQRFRMVEPTGNTWISTRETNVRRLHVRYRRTNPPPPLESMAGLWRVEAKATGVEVMLDHYFRVTDDSQETAAEAAKEISAIGSAMLRSLRRTAELGGVADLPAVAPEREAS